MGNGSNGVGGGNDDVGDESGGFCEGFGSDSGSGGFCEGFGSDHCSSASEIRIRLHTVSTTV